MKPRPRLRTALWHLRHGGPRQLATYWRRLQQTGPTGRGGWFTRSGLTFEPWQIPDRAPTRETRVGVILDDPSVFSGWDLSTRAIWTQNVAGSSFSGMGRDERRLTLGANFTYLRNCTVGLTYVDYIGSANIAAGRLLADRDYVSLNFKYTF